MADIQELAELRAVKRAIQEETARLDIVIEKLELILEAMTTKAVIADIA